MTREEAAQFFDGLRERLDIEDGKDWRVEVDALLLASGALRQDWVRAADRVPTGADGLTICVGENENGELIEQAGWSNAKKQSQKMRDDFKQKGYLYWLPLPPLPKLPEVDDD